MTLFNHTSLTSVKNKRIASSVCGLVGLLGMPPLPPPALLLLRMRVLDDDVGAVEEAEAEREDEGLKVVPGKALV